MVPFWRAPSRSPQLQHILGIECWHKQREPPVPNSEHQTGAAFRTSPCPVTAVGWLKAPSGGCLSWGVCLSSRRFNGTAKWTWIDFILTPLPSQQDRSEDCDMSPILWLLDRTAARFLGSDRILKFQVVSFPSNTAVRDGGSCFVFFYLQREHKDTKGYATLVSKELNKIKSLRNNKSIPSNHQHQVSLLSLSF